ncbi:MAG: hypothetical protein WCG83_05630 [Candidatus Peregrinibacteria bacterium]
MLSIGKVTADLISGNPMLQFGMQGEVFNLTQLARFLQPYIEVRAKKELQISGIVMALSRLQRQMKKSQTRSQDYHIQNMNIQTGLSTATYSNSAETRRCIHSFIAALQRRHGSVTFSEGTSEITIVYPQDQETLLKRLIPHHKKFVHPHISALRISFDERYITVPGFIYIILQQMLLQHINIVEVASTYTELTLFIDAQDTKIGFDTLYALFPSTRIGERIDGQVGL